MYARIAIAIFSLIFCFQNHLFAQQPPMTSSKSAGMIGVSESHLIDQMMVIMPGFAGEKGGSIAIEKSIKSFLMPPRKASSPETSDSYMLASCLEFYVNFQKNFKDNLSPDYIDLSMLGKSVQNKVQEGLKLLVEQGTVSAAILPYEAPTILPAVYATQRYKIKNYLHVFNQDTPWRQKVFELRRTILRGHPLMVEMNIPDNWGTIQNQKIISQVKDPLSQKRTFLVVGFNEQLSAVELMSTWGNEWGENGYLWVPYDDFTKMALNGYVMVL